VIEEKLTPPQPVLISVLTTSYPGISFQTPTFYAGPYTGVSPNLLGYAAGQLQVIAAGQVQVKTATQ